MTKRFNTTGTCFPHLHCVADVSAKFNVALKFVEYGEYFAINRPRQYGKTTITNPKVNELPTTIDGVDIVTHIVRYDLKTDFTTKKEQLRTAEDEED